MCGNQNRFISVKIKFRFQFNRFRDGAPIDILADALDEWMDELLGMGLSQISDIRNALGRQLDLILTNDTDNAIIMESKTPLSKIDAHHPPIEVHIDVTMTPISPTHIHGKYNFARADFDGLNGYMMSVDFESDLMVLDTDDAVDLLYDKLYGGLERFVPKVQRKDGHHPPWHNRTLATLKNRKTEAHKQHIAHRTADTYTSLCIARNEFSAAQKYYYDAYINDMQHRMISDPKQFWNYVNLKKKSCGFPRTMTLNGTMAQNEQEIANLFADFFETNFTTHGNDEYGETEANRAAIDGSFHITELSERRVLDALLRIDTSKSNGSDDMTPSLLRHCAHTLARPLTLIFNKSIRSMVFPTRWKTSHVTAIHKSGSRTDIKNYRGIAILPTIGKLFEHLINEQLAPYIQQRLHGQQHGFVQHKSCTTNRKK